MNISFQNQHFSKDKSLNYSKKLILNFNPLNTSPEYTWAGIHGKYSVIAKSNHLQSWVNFVNLLKYLGLPVGSTTLKERENNNDSLLY